MTNFIHTFKQQMLCIICCFSFLYTQSQPSYLTEQAEISVLTCGTGDEMYTLFGHTALRVKDFNQNLDVVYNWGMFDFRTPNFYSKFVKGNLLYYLDVSSFSDFFNSYTLDNRQVIEQELHLSYNQKMAIWNDINSQLKGPKRYYTYGFIKNNCTTKVVDVINNATQKPLNANFPANNHSYRFILNEGLNAHYFEKLGINLLFGYPTNQQNKLIFLPVKLQDALQYNQEIVQKEKVLYAKKIEQKGISLNSVYTLWVIVLLVALFAFKHSAQKIYFLVTAVFSLFFLAISLYSQHEELFLNMWIFFYNPLFFLALLFRSIKMLFVAIALTVIGLIFMGLELLQVAAPLITLHLVYIVALFLRMRKILPKLKVINV